MFTLHKYGTNDAPVRKLKYLYTAAATARKSSMILHCSSGFLIYLTVKYERSDIESIVINDDLWRIWKGIILMRHPSIHLANPRFITVSAVKCGTKQITEYILNPSVFSGGRRAHRVQFLPRLYRCYTTFCFEEIQLDDIPRKRFEKVWSQGNTRIMR